MREVELDTEPENKIQCMEFESSLKFKPTTTTTTTEKRRKEKFHLTLWVE